MHSVIEALNTGPRRGWPFVQYGNEWLEELGKKLAQMWGNKAKPASPEWGHLSEPRFKYTENMLYSK